MLGPHPPAHGSLGFRKLPHASRLAAAIAGR